MSILIMVSITGTIIFKLKYKILGFRTGPTPNGLRLKIPKTQMGLVRNAHFLGL